MQASRTLHDVPQLLLDDQAAWDMVVLMAAMAPALFIARERMVFAWSGDVLTSTLPSDPGAIVAWEPSSGWDVLLDPADPRHGVLDLWLPICGATPAHP